MILRSLARRALITGQLPELMLRYRARHAVTVLGYHRVHPPLSKEYPFNEAVLSATPDEFARELKYLRANMDVISVSDLLACLRNSSLMPKRPAVITFDDGYVDNHRYALPLLREAGLPACFFACTGIIGTRAIPWYEAWVCCLKCSRVSRIDSPFGPDDPPYKLDRDHRQASVRRFRSHMRLVPWEQVPARMQQLSDATGVNPDEHLSEPLFMSWEQVRDLTAAGMQVGGHTRTHPALSCVSDPLALDAEIGGCFDDLQRELGRAPVAFAYPFGEATFMSARADAAIERAGFQISFSFLNGMSPRHRAGTWRIPRVHASHVDDYQSFRLRMAIAPQIA